MDSAPPANQTMNETRFEMQITALDLWRFGLFSFRFCAPPLVRLFVRVLALFCRRGTPRKMIPFCGLLRRNGAHSPHTHTHRTKEEPLCTHLTWPYGLTTEGFQIDRSICNRIIGRWSIQLLYSTHHMVGYRMGPMKNRTKHAHSISKKTIHR